ncbi:hypothetical protein CsSME_00046058 [Camellia sinensis var. sinensis]
MLERRMAQGKDLSSVLFFCFLLVPLEYNLPYLLKHKKLLFCFLLWLHYTWVLGSLGDNLWNALYFRFGMFGPFIYMRFYSSQNLTVWAAATRTIRAEGSLSMFPSNLQLPQFDSYKIVELLMLKSIRKCYHWMLHASFVISIL